MSKLAFGSIIFHQIEAAQFTRPGGSDFLIDMNIGAEYYHP